MFQKILIILFISIVSPLVAFHLEWKKCLNYQVNVSPNSSNTWKMITRRKKNLQQFIRPDKLQCFTVVFFFFFIRSPNWASKEAAAAACKCPRGEHMFSDVWGFVSIWENDERELGANDPTYWLANAVLDTTLGNVTESICQFVSRGLQIATVWLSHFEWILCFFFFSEENPGLMECFQGIVEKFYDRDTIFRAIFYSFVSCKLPKRGLLFPLSKFERNRAEMRMKISISKKQDSCRQYIIVVRGAFFFITVTLFSWWRRQRRHHFRKTVVCFIFTTLLFYCVKW